MLDDGLLDISYVMDLPPQQIPGFLKSLTNPGTAQEAQHAFGTMRVPWLEVHCSDGLQARPACLGVQSWRVRTLAPRCCCWHAYAHHTQLADQERSCPSRCRGPLCALRCR